VIVQFVFNEIEPKSLVLVLIMGAFFYYEIKAKPYDDKRLNRASSYSIIVILASFCVKLFTFSLKNEIWDKISDILILSLNVMFLGEVILKMIFAKRKDIYYFASSKKSQNNILKSILKEINQVKKRFDFQKKNFSRITDKKLSSQKT